MLRRQRTDGGAPEEEPAPRRLLIASTSAEVRDAYAGLLGSRGFATMRCEMPTLAKAAAEEHFGCAVVVGTGADDNTAIAQVDRMRNSESQQVRRTAALLIASSRRNQIYAWEAGIDGLLVVPAHLNEVVAAVEEILARPRLERYEHRQAMLAAAPEQ